MEGSSYFLLTMQCDRKEYMLDKFEAKRTKFECTSFTMHKLVQKLELEAALKWLDEMSLILVEGSYLDIWRYWENFSSIGNAKVVLPSQSLNLDRN
jgi:hypothetical protein